MEWCEHYKTLSDNLNQGVYFLDKDRKIIYWNNAAEKITGYLAEEVIGKSCADDVLVHINEQGKNLCQNCELCPVASVFTTGNAYEGELYLRHREGYRILVSIKAFPVKNNEQKIIGAIEIFDADSERDTLNLRIKELEKLALLDSLTMIANRRFIEMQLSSRINEYKRFGWQFGVLFIDIDYFKLVNDRYGHDTGDRVLKMIANVLVKNSRSFDLVGRWGGEEFIVIVSNVNEGQLYTIAHKFKNLIAFSTLKSNSDLINVTVSIGATPVRQKDTLRSIIKRADKLMYQSKQNGRNKVTTDFEIT